MPTSNNVETMFFQQLDSDNHGLKRKALFFLTMEKVWFRHSYFLSLPANVSRRSLIRDLQFCNPLLSIVFGVDNIDPSLRFEL
jgi:hypothetical protein